MLYTHPLLLDISRPPLEEFELRVIIWEARNCPHMDEIVEMNDMYITGSMITSDENGRLNEAKKETDTHWRAKEGVGSFNYRWKFPVGLPVGD